MNYFLFLIVMALCGAGCVGYILLKETSDAEAQQLAGFRGTLESFQTKDKNFREDDAQFSTQLKAVRVKTVGLTKQIQALREIAEGKAKSSQIPLTIRLTKAAKPKPRSNDLGTVTTTDGNTYQDCHLIKVEEDCIVVTYPDGIVEIYYRVMPPALQKRFGFDPRKGQALTDDQVETEEEERQAANDAAGVEF
jgi:hypothetical protein